MELEFFCKPGTELDWFAYWKDYCANFLKSLGLSDEFTRLRDHTQEELAHYSNACTDIEYLFPFGWGELWGIASRTDYDLMAHQTHSGEDMSYLDPETNERYVPYCIEPSVGEARRRKGQGRCKNCSQTASSTGSVQGSCASAFQEA